MSDRPYQNLAIIGHVDHGKSTLIGRLLFETGSVPEHVIEQHREEAEEKGRGGFKFAYAMGDLAEECEHGVTIDTAHRGFDMGEFYSTIADCPDHRDFVKSMIIGASQADNAVLVVAADDSVAPQARKHVFLIRTLGISEFVITINKMDVVDCSEDKYKDVRGQVSKFLEQIRFNSDDAIYVPISVSEGDSAAERSDNTSQRDGDILPEALDNLSAPQPPTDAPSCLSIQDACTTFGIDTAPVGRIETGTLNPGDNVNFQPPDVGGEVKTIGIHHEEVDQAGPGGNVGFNVRGADKDDIRRGDTCGPVDDPPRVAEMFKTQVVVAQHPSVITVSYTPAFHAHMAQVACAIKSVGQKLGPTLGKVAEKNLNFIKFGDAAIMAVRPQKSLSTEPSSEIPELGSSAVRDMGQTIAAGRVLEVNER